MTNEHVNLEEVLLDSESPSWDELWTLRTNPIDGTDLLNDDGIDYAFVILGDAVSDRFGNVTDDAIAVQTHFEVGYLLGWHGVGLPASVLYITRANDLLFESDGLDVDRLRWLTDGWAQGARDGAAIFSVVHPILGVDAHLGLFTIYERCFAAAARFVYMCGMDPDTEPLESVLAAIHEHVDNGHQPAPKGV